MYRRYADEVFRYSLAVLRSRADAEDVAQTVFVRALRAVERGERVAKPRNWLIKIAHNECMRLLASRKVHAELPDELAVEPIERGRADELRGALAALPEHQRQALVLRELEGRTYAEIADRLQLSVSAVETLLFRARRALREQLDGAVGCDEFALLLDDPDADRSRLRAHARVCESCARLERRARGRKSRLGRIASTLFPWWGTGAKVAAVALGTATITGVVVTTEPHPVSGAAVPAPPAKAADGVRVSHTVKTPPVRHAVAFRRTSSPEPDPIPPGDDPLPVPEPTQPDPPPVPAPPTHEATPPAPAPVPAPAGAPEPAPAPAASPAPVLVPSVTTTASSATTEPTAVTTPVATATVPTVTVPTDTVTTPEATVSPVTTPVATTPAVTVPSVTISTPTVSLPLPNVSGP
jgi:RNA polymerase sigma factor (sigma-70 family)